MATRKTAQPAPKREPSKEVWPLLDTFQNIVMEHGEERGPDLLEEFLYHIVHQAAERTSRMLKQAEINERLGAVAARRK